MINQALLTNNPDIAELISDLDTKRFGFPIAKVNTWDLGIETIVSGLKKLDVKLIISKVDATQINLINTLEDNGFRIKDSQVTYKHNLKNISYNDQLPSPIKVRPFVKEDIPSILAIARESFQDYGHYFANVKLKKELCLEVYEDWTRRCCMENNVADQIFVGLLDNKVVGFESFKIVEENNLRYAYCVLAAVSKASRNTGVLTTIAKQSLEWCKEMQLSWQEHNALVYNYPINYLLSKLGYHISRSFYTLHNWIQ